MLSRWSGQLHPVKIAGRRGTRLGTLDEKAIGELKTALLGASGLLIALSAAEPEYGDLVEEAIASLDDDWPLSRNIVGILGVSRKQSEDLSLIDHVWDCLVQAGALVIPGAVVVDAQAKSFDANGLPKVARHRASARMLAPAWLGWSSAWAFKPILWNQTYEKIRLHSHGWKPDKNLRPARYSNNPGPA